MALSSSNSLIFSGEAVGGSYIYDECAAAELAFDASSHVQETAVVLNVVSAGEIFLAAHKAHTTFVETIIEKGGCAALLSSLDFFSCCVSLALSQIRLSVKSDAIETVPDLAFTSAAVLLIWSVQ